MTNEAHSGHRMCSSILSWWTQQMREKQPKFGRKKKKDAEMRRTFRRWLLESDEPPSLSAGVKYRKLLLYNSKSKGTFFSSFPCLFVWITSSFISFYGHMHAEGITARIFKETAAFLRQSCPQRWSSTQPQICTFKYLGFKLYCL